MEKSLSDTSTLCFHRNFCARYFELASFNVIKDQKTKKVHLDHHNIDFKMLKQVGKITLTPQYKKELELLTSAIGSLQVVIFPTIAIKR